MTRSEAGDREDAQDSGAQSAPAAAFLAPHLQRLKATPARRHGTDEAKEPKNDPDARWPGGGRATAAVACGLFLIAFVGSLATADRSRYNDEELWQQRSQQFVTGLLAGDAARMTAYDVEKESTATSITMPGVPTMWVGSAVILAECSKGERATSFRACVEQSSGPSLPNVHRVMALLGAALVSVLWLISRRLLGPLAAFLACFLIATEPFLATLRTMFHTDSLVMSFSLIGFVALCRALEFIGEERHRVALAAGAGVSLSCAALTKLSAAAVVPALVLCVAWAGVRSWRRSSGSHRARMRSLVRSPMTTVLLVCFGCALLTAALLWPALVIDPARQLGALRSSAQLSGAGHNQFFRGSVTRSPPWYFYPWVVAFRLTPWSFLGLLTIPAVVVARRIDTRWWLFLAFTASQLLVIGVSAKKLDRYGAGLVAGCLVLVAISVDSLFGAQIRNLVRTRPIGVAAVSTVAVLAVSGHFLAVAARGFASFNPTLRRLPAASRPLMVSWGEARFVADDWLAERVGDTNSSFCTVKGSRIECPPGDGPHFVVTFIANTQRGRYSIPPEVADSWELVDSYTIDDVDMIQFWKQN